MTRILTFIVFVALTTSTWASHIVGGDIYYDYLGNNQYRIWVSVYRDCLSNGAAFDSPLNLGIFRNSNNTRFTDVQIPFPGSQLVPVTFNNPCVTPPSNICNENALYTTVVTLPPIPGGYRVAYQRCCRGPNINNLQNPDDTGLTLTVDIPTSDNNFHINNSARFNNYPPMLLCNNDDLVFDHSATDPDGDQLVYSLATPFAGGSSFDPMPIPIPQPPYPFVAWDAGYSAAQPLGPGSSINIDPNTGLLTASPNLTGRYVVGIRVQEYRNGVLINTMIRDFIFQVFNCNISMQAIVPDQEDFPTFVGYCNGLTVQFENQSFGGTNYQWDFGVPGTTTDVSTQFEPTYTYPDTGVYYAQLVVNPGWPCTDTAIVELKMYNELNTTFTHTDSICLVNNAFSFTASSDGPSNTLYEWNFGAANPTTQTGQQVNGIHFLNEGYNSVTLNASYAVCEASHTDSVYVIPEPIADFEMPFNYECDGLTVNFINNTTNATFFEWDFGFNNQTSNLEEPSFTFPAGGSYTVQMIASSNPFCIDTMVRTVTVNELMTVNFTQSPDQCITGNSFDFIGMVTGPPHATFSWDFGPNASIQTSTDTSVFGVSFNAVGVHTVTFTGQFDQCVESQSSEVFIYTQPTIGFSMIDSLQCAPFRARFFDQSTSETPIYYSWDFGDGGTSTEANPVYIYDQPGAYPVTLTIRTEEGCIDTLTLMRTDLVNVFPTPVAAFDMSTLQTDICHPTVFFTDQSIDATRHYYKFDDGPAFSMDPNPFHNFMTAGMHHPYLVASNEEGCSDTARVSIYIEPYSVFIPNTFTPDGDEFNNVFEAKMWLDPAEWHFRVYDRWGELVFESFDPHIGWDGTYNGRLVQSGTYLYTLKYKPCTQRYAVEELNGYVNVLR